MNARSSDAPRSPDEEAHSEQLLNAIRTEIERSRGWISFERYMEMVLYQPGLGYYSAGSRKLGADGDFITAPEISPLFSRCVARQCAEVLGELSDGDILELGAGSGTMAIDVLTELAALNRLPRRYFILEVSADLRDRQHSAFKDRAPQFLPLVEWLDVLPAQMTGIIVGNEVLDALPVRRFAIRGENINELGVTWQLGRLEASEIRADESLRKAVRELEHTIGYSFPDGYTSEINARLASWISGLANALVRGVMLFVDYGLPRAQYYNRERTQGTLLCHFRHRFHDDVFANVGLQDIGAWVDFTAVAEAAVANECTVAGFTTQAHFLIGCGIETLLADLAQAELRSRLQIGRQAMVLTLPGEMGERFKAIALGKNWNAPLRGFAVRDLAAAL